MWPERGGFDGVTYWTRTGASLGVTPPETQVPLAMPGPGFGDLQTGAALAGGIGTALFHRERTGKGVVVDVSLLSMGLWAMGMTISGTSVLDVDQLPHQHHGNATNPLVNEYRTKDGGFVALAFLQSDRYWPEFCVLVERYDWLSPAILRFLRRVVTPTKAAGVPVAVCGEMGGRTLEAMALIGLGIERLSITPAAIGPVKAMLRTLDRGALQQVLSGWLDTPPPDMRAALAGWAEQHGVEFA